MKKALKSIKKSRPSARPKARPAKAAVTRPAKLTRGVKPTAKSPAKAAGARESVVVSITEAQIRRMPASAYMNDTQLSFFRARLLQNRQEVLARQSEVKDRLNQHENFADPADRASAEEEHWLDLRLRERESFLLRKIDEALRRISEREYGFCKTTGEPIGIPRLLARPTAEVCVDVKGQNEHVEAQFRDR